MTYQHTALVTGGMGGLGESIARTLHDAGHSVLVTHSPNNDHVQTWLQKQASEATTSLPTLSMWPILTTASDSQTISKPKAPLSTY